MFIDRLGGVPNQPATVDRHSFAALSAEGVWVLGGATAQFGSTVQPATAVVESKRAGSNQHF
jgi:hypothetical protein